MPLFVRVQWPICGFNECFGRALGKGGVFYVRPWVRLVGGGSNEGQRGE